MKSIPQTQLVATTTLNAAYHLSAEDQAFKLNWNDSEALCQIRPGQDTCVVVRVGVLVRRHFCISSHHQSAVEQVLRIDYGINNP